MIRKQQLLTVAGALLLCASRPSVSFAQVTIAVDTRLDADITCAVAGPCVDIVADGIDVNGTDVHGRRYTIDCSGVPDSVGVRIHNHTDVRLHDLEVKNCTYGVVAEQPGGVAALYGRHHLYDLFVHDIAVDGIVVVSGFLNGPGFTWVLNNRVTHAGRWGIYINESRGNHLRGNSTTSNLAGIVVDNVFCGPGWPDCTANDISRNDVSGNGLAGIRLSYANNVNIQQNVANDTAAGAGISLFGGSDQNVVLRNRVENNLHGILLHSLTPVGAPDPNYPDFNTVRGNIVSNNQGDGIGVAGSRNLTQANRATGNGVDLRDYHDDCDGNVWRANRFVSAMPAACIR